MPIPWLRLIDGVLGVRDVARVVRTRTTTDAGAGLETPLVGVVLGALREAFNRDSERLQLERQRLDDERARAERALQLELLRQAGEREMTRLRLLGGAALVSMFAALFFATRLSADAATGRIVTAIGALLLLGALAAAFSAHAHVVRLLATGDAGVSPGDFVEAPAGRAVPWLLLAGLAVLTLGVIVL